MSPPNTPGVPGTKLPQATQEIVRKRANSHGDSEPPIEIDEDEPQRNSVAEFGTEVQANYGKNKFAGPAWALLVLAALASVVAVTYFVTRNSDGSRPPSDAVLNELRAFRDEQHQCNTDTKLQLGLLTGRVGSLETGTSELRSAIGGIAAANPRFAPPINVAMSQALTQQHK